MKETAARIGIEKEMRVRTGTKHMIQKGEGKMNVLDELQAAMDMVFGLQKPDGRARKFSTLYELYTYYSGDEAGLGVFNPRRLPSAIGGSMDINSSSFPNALANSLNRFLSAGYHKISYFENVLISQKAPAIRLGEGVFAQLGCWKDLPGIDPETEDYPDMPQITDAGNPFDLLQKGCVIPISRRAIVNDDVELLAGLITRSGLVARKTHARYVWNKWINNENCNDGTAWFTTAHGNLGTNALSIAQATAAVTALAAMVEPGPSTDVLGMDLRKPQFYLVVAPPEWDEAVKVNQTQYTYSANDLTNQATNPCYRLFGENNQRIATPPFLTGSDWGVIRDPEEIPSVEMEYLNGNEEPEIYFEQNPESDMAMRGDWFGLKVRHEYGGSVSDYRGAHKSTP